MTTTTAPAIVEPLIMNQPVLTVDQQTLLAHQRAGYGAQMRSNISARRQARDRAKELLEEFLDEEQKQQIENFGHFNVQGSSGRMWRIFVSGIVGNVWLLDSDGRRLRRYCAHPSDTPEADAFLAQMLLLATDEEAFLAVANDDI